MTLLGCLGGVGVWAGVAAAVALIIGRAIRLRDTRRTNLDPPTDPNGDQ